jgi:hypothetical protein
MKAVKDDPKNPFPVNINLPLLQCFVDAAHGNDHRKRRSTYFYLFLNLCLLFSRDSLIFVGFNGLNTRLRYTNILQIV